MLILLERSTDFGADMIGGKALGLIRLIRIGIRVPDGFCITSAAYERHINQHLGESMRDMLKQVRKARASEKSRILAGIQHRIIEPAIDPGLAESLMKYYTELKAPLMAVRSSATAEDQKCSSFAGQYETILGVSSFEGLQSAVKECWASLWSERAFEYCRKNGLDHASLAMAVIVQRQVAADFAGIAFTADPGTGRTDRVMIEYIPGLGDRLVSGRTEPRRLTVAKRDLRISGAAENGRVLDLGIIKKLAALAVRAEQKLGGPQDIEWAVQGNRIFFLQARPITTLPAVSRFEDRQIWTDANTGEVLPDVVTPLTWSVTIPLVMTIFNSGLRLVGAELKENIICGLIAGRVYFNLNSITGLARNIPGFRKLDLTKVFGGAQGGLGDLSNITIPDEDIPDIRLKISNMALAFPLRMMRLLFVISNNDSEILSGLQDKIERFARIELRSRTEKELMTLWREVMARLQRGFQDTANAGMAMLFYPNLDKLCQKWLGSKPGVMVNQLLAGIGDMESAMSGLALYEMARTARDNPRLKRTLEQSGDWVVVKKRIKGIDGGRDFLASWDGFMARYGHHTRSEIELYYPRWAESPDHILGLLRNYLRAGAKDDALDKYKEVVAQRLFLTRQCNERLRNPFKRMIFNFHLKRAQRGSVIRENMKSLAVKALYIIRRIALELGARLKERKVIDHVEDIFFLDLGEVQKAIADRDASGIKKTIARRRVEYKRNLKIRPPHVIKGRFDPDDLKPLVVDKGVKVLKGLAVSPGLVRGKARVIINTISKDRVRPGEILIAPYTDPGWALYFMTASAIVVDMGGLLSHGSIVAREYGIPAVVNVGPATRIIRTGQMVQVDGDQGIVTILDR